jgi:hypothetical protein
VDAKAPRPNGGGAVSPRGTRVRDDAASRRWFALGLFLAAVGALYALASDEPGLQTERSARKGLVALNAGANASLLTAAGAPGAGLLAGALGLGAAYDDATREPRYKAALGWANWILPMSWPVNLVGALALLGDVLAHAATGGTWERARIHHIEFDRRSGTVITEGGLLVLPGFHGGFNFGAFSFVTPGARSVIEHESGHAYNLAAFGWVFHLIGGWDRKFRRDPLTAYAERLAEGNRPDSVREDRVRMWRA